MVCNGTRIDGASFFNRLLEIESCPLLFLLGRFWISLFISFVLVRDRNSVVLLLLDILLIYSSILVLGSAILLANLSPTDEKNSQNLDVILSA